MRYAPLVSCIYVCTYTKSPGRKGGEKEPLFPSRNASQLLLGIWDRRFNKIASLIMHPTLSEIDIAKAQLATTHFLFKHKHTLRESW
jgi:hypothetical protein